MTTTTEGQVHHVALRSPEQYCLVTVHRFCPWEHRMAGASPYQLCLLRDPPCSPRLHRKSVVAAVQEYLIHAQC
jgi:hypothetical protein